MYWADGENPDCVCLRLSVALADRFAKLKISSAHVIASGLWSRRHCT